MRQAMVMVLALGMVGCGSDVVIQAGPPDDPPPPTIPDDPPDDPPPDDPPPDDPPPDDPPPDPPDPASCEVAVTVESVAGTMACGYGGVANFSPGTLLAVEAAPEVAGLRFTMEGCPDGADCTCEVTISCVGEDIAAVYANASPLSVSAWIQPNELIVGHPGPWECLDCPYGPPFFHAAGQLDTTSTGGTLEVEVGALVASQAIGSATFETRELDATAYMVGGLAPVQMTLGSASAAEGQDVALVMEDDLLALAFRNLRSTWCTAGCDASDPTPESSSWVVYGPALF